MNVIITDKRIDILSKLCIYVKLVDNDDVVIDKKLFGIFNNGVLKYDDGVINNLYLNKLILERICDDYEMIFNFNEMNCICNYNGNCFVMDFLLLDSNVSSNTIYFKYKIVDTGHIYEYSVMW